jgi:arsenate reductase
MEIWLNPACSKGRAAVSELDAAGLGYTVRRYLDDPPSVEELAGVVARLGLEPSDIARPVETAAAGIDLPRGADHRADTLAAVIDAEG